MENLPIKYRYMNLKLRFDQFAVSLNGFKRFFVIIFKPKKASWMKFILVTAKVTRVLKYSLKHMA